MKNGGSGSRRSARSRSGRSISRDFRGSTSSPARRRTWDSLRRAMRRPGAQPSFISRTATPRSHGSWCVGSRRRRCRAPARRTWSWRASTIASLTARTLRCASGSAARLLRRAMSGTMAREVEVIYARGGTLHAARATAAVLACWNCMIPYLCPEMPARQRDALHSLVKTPLVYTTVAPRNWRAFKALGVAEVYAPGSYHDAVRLNSVVDIGSYMSGRSPDEPILVRMTRVPCAPGLDPRSQFRAGRGELLATSFETFERNIRDQLARVL